jgi:hypothetical protein
MKLLQQLSSRDEYPYKNCIKAALSNFKNFNLKDLDIIT